ncbi:helix-turn-helix transcriptional regulator [Jonesia quinghaiensis]|uniref:helix-turn-helix transcriptional regulator n=1 Tax=Jonesia quinghaiensis TaxID=262806 RepID=UPI0003FECA15|nr:helix-turn-helix transcriptional regulator [Jonesia quinghaiensis]
MKITSAHEAARLIHTSRVLAEITQQQLAERVGVTRQTIARIEQGKGGASFDTYLAVFKELDITLTGQPESHTDDTSSWGQAETPERNWVTGLSQKLSQHSTSQTPLTTRSAKVLNKPFTTFLEAIKGPNVNETLGSMVDLHLRDATEGLLADHKKVNRVSSIETSRDESGD